MRYKHGHADQLQRAPAEGPAYRAGRQDPAHLRALRTVHRHLPHLRAARRRARFPARSHLSDEGHVRARCQGHPCAPAPYRSLPLLPLLHDHLPERRRLHAPRRRGPRAYRGHRAAQPQGARRAPPLGLRAAQSAPVPPGARRGAFRSPAPRPHPARGAQGGGGDAGAGAGEPGAARGLRGARHRRHQGGAPEARDTARRLRPAGAEARDQRRHHPAAGAPRRRCGGGRQRRLLRCAGASHGPRGRPPSPWPGATSMRGRG